MNLLNLNQEFIKQVPSKNQITLDRVLFKNYKVLID